MSGLTYQKKLFLMFSAAFLVVTLFLIGFFYTYVYRILLHESAVAMSQTSGAISEQLDTLVYQMDIVSTQVIANNDVQSAMHGALNFPASGNYFDDYPEISQRLRNALSAINSPLIAYGRLGVFNSPTTFASTGHLGSDVVSFPLNYHAQYDAVLSKLDTLSDRKLLLPPHLDNWVSAGDSTVVISFIREIRDISYSSFQLIGYVEVQQPYAYLADLCSANVPGSYEIAVIDADGNFIYPYTELTEEQRDNFLYLSSADTASGVVTYQGTRQQFSRQFSAATGWTTIVRQGPSAYLSPIIALRNLVVLFSVLFYLASFTLIFLITRSLTVPIRKFRDKIQAASLSDMAFQPNLSSNNEILLLDQAFDEALRQLRRSTQETIAANTREINAHMLALQAQMNPHFLFNTLMAISGIAVQDKNDRIVSICSKLSEMLRYTAAYREQNVTLNDEFTHARNYLALMKVRYGDFLDYHVEVDERLLPIPVPKLILQPLIENSFLHGFSDCEPPYRISVRSSVTPDACTVCIRDNGDGFTEEALRAFRQNCEAQSGTLLTAEEQKFNAAQTDVVADYLSNSQLGRIGMTNIYLRLKLLWGDQLIFTVENDNGAVITLGKKTDAKKGEEDASTVDCGR